MGYVLESCRWYYTFSRFLNYAHIASTAGWFSWLDSVQLYHFSTLSVTPFLCTDRTYYYNENQLERNTLQCLHFDVVVLRKGIK